MTVTLSPTLDFVIAKTTCYNEDARPPKGLRPLRTSIV